MKTVYKATRRDKNALLRDIKPGTKLYVINEHAPISDPRHKGVDGGPGRTYSPWVVSNERMPFTGNIIARTPLHDGFEPVESLLAKEREIHTVKPPYPMRGPEPHSSYSVEAYLAARDVAERHAEEAAAAMSRRYAAAR
ncbi:hypothetical protein [Streptomyces hydrogenans]